MNSDVPAMAPGADPDHGADRGSATLWAAGASAAVCTLLAVVLMICAATITRHRAAAAADLAALAAAAHALGTQQAACARAGWVARKMRVTLRSCWLDGADVRVEVTAQPPGALGTFGAASAHARAGPARGRGRDRLPRGTVDSERRTG
jgi:secretion/DNA translocation related TadE-like protein